MNGFVFGGVSSADLQIIMTAPPDEQFAEQDIEQIVVPGRMGTVAQSNNRYHNGVITFHCAISNWDGDAYSDSMRDLAIDAVARLIQPAGRYARLESTYDTNHYRLAMLTRPVEITSLAEETGLFDLQFDCLPQRFLKTGEQPFAMNAPGTVHGISDAFPANPIITLRGTGAGKLVVGGQTLEILSLTDCLVLDCETQNAYRIADGQHVDANNAIYAPEFPSLALRTDISWSGGISEVEIIPRWWRL